MAIKIGISGFGRISRVVIRAAMFEDDIEIVPRKRPEKTDDYLPFENVERVAGKSKWSFKKLFKYSLDGIIGFSSKPLKIPFYFGTFTALASFAPLIYLIYHWINWGFSMGSTGITSSLILYTILAAATLLLISLGIIGQYIAKVYDEVKGRPHYIVTQTNKKDLVNK